MKKLDMAQYEVFRCCENLSCNWLQKLLGYNGNELNGTTHCTGKLQIFEVIKADDSGHNRLQWVTVGYDR